MADTKIEWTDSVWNPVVGCSLVSPGCTNCYAMRMAARLEKVLPPERRGAAILPNQYAALTKPSNAGPVWTGRVNRAPDSVFLKPLLWKRPRRIFVNSMGDLFHESVPDAWIDCVFAVMALAPQHTFQILTKRSKRMRAYANDPRTPQRVASQILSFCANSVVTGPQALAPLGVRSRESDPSCVRWPLANVWKGVSAERQQEADERVPDLLATPAAVRFVSAEPLLGGPRLNEIKSEGRVYDALRGEHWVPQAEGVRYDLRRWPHAPRLDWIIVGGESGPGARPMQVEWARSIVEQCRSASVACFVKQLGADPIWSDGAFLNLRNRKGGDMAEWPEDLRIREMPSVTRRPSDGRRDDLDN